ncbi:MULTISPECIES: hypothetical protein [Leuconostoc]|uniref:Transglycosylase associated protein n=1 Tax=Leuconostoc suionicum TaxID=1511761 RepID=A0A2N9K900_9LACO|nr:MULTISPECIES: hypothetical protein [Leuconostoc]MBE4728182.1 hypothetical protein [Leuconostoc suionicum]MCT4401752.1 hypothetical protein [Leuconostoc suionicum]MDI6498150.1 hypothetical protein [Leuconostoc suionicum]MDI6500065.1 hypothetical protein [Leuconostoc suionicum]MDI6502121.1 hypothetical protein [Leuconostoc suionicum]
MAVVLNIILGVIAGAGVAFLGNMIKTPGTELKKMLTLAVGIILGGLGSVAGDQLLNYGPTFLDSNFVPAIVGGVVLAFVGVYAGKKWLHLGIA